MAWQRRGTLGVHVGSSGLRKPIALCSHHPWHLEHHIHHVPLFVRVHQNVRPRLRLMPLGYSLHRTRPALGGAKAESRPGHRVHTVRRCTQYGAERLTGRL